MRWGIPHLVIISLAADHSSWLQFQGTIDQAHVRKLFTITHFPWEKAVAKKNLLKDYISWYGDPILLKHQ